MQRFGVSSLAEVGKWCLSTNKTVRHLALKAVFFARDRRWKKGGAGTIRTAASNRNLKELMGGKDVDAKAFAAKTLPTVRMHLQMARDMMASMKGMGGGMSGMN